MVKTVKPTKEQVREYMGRRQAEHKPPPNCKEIRRQLGWEMDEIAEMAHDKQRRHHD
jgi:hypothetical protein